MMRSMILAVIATGFGGMAHAGIPALNATCPGNIELHVDAGGYAYINGKEAEITVYDAGAFDAKHGHTTISVTMNPDGTATVSYTARHGASGMCQAEVYDDSAAEVCPANVSEANRVQYPACN